MTDPIGSRNESETLLTEEEREELIPSYITLRSELNEAEQANIVDAQAWALRRRRDVLNESFLDNLHRRMYGNVWRWAGQHRASGKNIGAAPYRIPIELRELIDNCRYWIANETYGPDDIAARFHHKLVWVHCYPNGNGRHARLATDLLLIAMGQQVFSWGSANLVDEGQVRANYISALREADRNDIEPLLDFVRS
jgi:Fic-DOC domain mobile mystery protein B